MSKPNLTGIVKNTQRALKKHSPEILTGLGIAGMITSTVLAVKATPKALELLEEAKIEREEESLTKADVVKIAWKCYIPATVTGAVSIACLIGASSVHAKRNAALATVYKLSETALAEYRDKVIETIGEKKEHTVREKVAEERIKNDPVSKKEIHITGTGETLCYEPLSARYFKSDIELIKRAENTINKRMLQDICGTATVNEFYDELGLSHTELGDDLGWGAEHLIDLEFTSHLTDDGKPCLVVGHYNAPRYDIL